MSDEAYRQTLSALVDNELSENERSRVLDRIAHDPQARDRVGRYQAQNAALKALFPVGPETAYRIIATHRAPWWKQAGIGAFGLLFGLVLGFAPGRFIPYFSNPQPAFAKNAEIAYKVYAPEQRHPVEVLATDEKHLTNWLSRRLDYPLTIPSLSEYGYSLVGGRLLPGESGAAAQFMYQNKSGKRLTLYVTAASRRTAAIRLLRGSNEQGTFYWVNKGMGYALSGQLSGAHLRSMAIDVCGALGGSPEIWQ